MNQAEIKIDLFRKLDSLKGKSLKEAYGIITNYINKGTDLSDWENLTKEQKEALNKGIQELEKGEGVEHNKVMKNISQKYL